MSTELQKLDEGQRALTVVFNECKEKDSLSSYLGELFESGQIVYRESSAPDADNLMDLLKNEKDAGRIVMPSGRSKIVFGWFMDLNDFTDEWCDRYISRALKMMHDLEAGESSDQHNLICLRYEVGSFPSEEERKEKAGLLIRLVEMVKKKVEEGGVISQSIYLIRKNRLGNYDSQEKCVARLLYLLSRRGKAEVKDLGITRGYCLGMVNGEDFFEEQKERYQEEIDSLEKWVSNRIDPSLERLSGQIIQLMESKLYAVREYEKDYNRRIPKFPVNIQDFEGGFFRGYESTIGKNHPRIKEYRERFLTVKRKELISDLGKDMVAIRQLVENSFCFLDCAMLDQYLEEQAADADVKDSPTDRLYSMVIQMLRMNGTSDEENMVIPMYEVIRDNLKTAISGYEKKKEANEQMITVNKRKLAEAGNYTNLDECLQKIMENSQMRFTHGEESFDTRTTILVSGRCESNWEMKHYSVRNCDLVHGCRAISPYEIAVLTTYMMVNLEQENNSRTNEMNPKENGSGRTEEMLLKIIY